MNISELARQVRLSTKELRAIMPLMGYDIGGRAIKVDNKIAQDIVRKLNQKALKEKLLNTLKDQDKAPEFGEIQDDTAYNGQNKEINIPSQVMVKDLARQMHIDVTKLVVELMRQGVMASLNDKIDYETASIVAEDFGWQAKLVFDSAPPERPVEAIVELLGAAQGLVRPRPPVVVVMGHVDHGKTKLLDAIRKTNVVDQESGGITQHIGAYQVAVSDHAEKTSQTGDQILTFIDTPGHEAFSLMRSRGARVADLAILVVAADDGVQPQTIEAVSHIKKAGLPFVVAINKIDKTEANQDNVKSGLAEIGITAEDWGGDVMMVPVSAKSGQNIQGLLESVLLLYEVEQDKITADPAGLVVGTIIESHIDQGSGPMATVLVRSGTLRQGQDVLVGDIPGRIRLMKDWLGQVILVAGPSVPVAVLGLKSTPQVGDILRTVERSDIRKSLRQHKKRTTTAVFKDRYQRNLVGMNFNLIIKADVLGSLEALQESMSKLANQNISLNIISQGLGNINESDIISAATSQAYVLGFNVSAAPEVQDLARSQKVTVKTFEIIYDFLDFVAEEAGKKLNPEILKKSIGVFRILKVFRQEKDCTIVGGKVVSGEITKTAQLEHQRQGQTLGQGTIVELQSGKEAVTQVVQDQEAGVKVSGLNEIQPGDDLQAYIEETKKQKIEL